MQPVWESQSSSLLRYNAIVGAFFVYGDNFFFYYPEYKTAAVSLHTTLPSTPHSLPHPSLHSSLPLPSLFPSPSSPLLTPSPHPHLTHRVCLSSASTIASFVLGSMWLVTLPYFTLSPLALTPLTHPSHPPLTSSPHTHPSHHSLRLCAVCADSTERSLQHPVLHGNCPPVLCHIPASVCEGLPLHDCVLAALGLWCQQMP